MVSINNKAELLGELVDVVEDMLEARSVTLPVPEIDIDDDEDNAAIIRGSDYDEMAGGFCETLKNWNLVESEDKSGKEYFLEGYIPDWDSFGPFITSGKNLREIMKTGEDLWKNILDPYCGFQDVIRGLVVSDSAYMSDKNPLYILEENKTGVSRWKPYDQKTAE